MPIHGRITKCVNKGTLTTANYNSAGGIVGYATNSTEIKQSSSYADLNCVDEYSVGGIVGYTNICTVEECFNAGNITGKTPVGGICGGTTKTIVKNCYNIGKIIGNSKIGGIIGTVTPYETAEGHEYVYNCYSIGMIVGTSDIDCWIGSANYLTYDYIYTTKTIYDKVGEGNWKNLFGNMNWGALSGTDKETKNALLSNLQKENGTNKWTIDTTGIKNSGYPYLIENKPE